MFGVLENGAYPTAGRAKTREGRVSSGRPRASGIQTDYQKHLMSAKCTFDAIGDVYIPKICLWRQARKGLKQENLIRERTGLIGK